MHRRIETVSISLASVAADGFMKLNSNGALFESWASYGHDVILSFSSYLLLSACDPSGSIRNRAILAFSLPAGAEILQGLNLYPGTFDWYDFIAFGLGVGLAAITERFIFRQSLPKIIQP